MDPLIEISSNAIGIAPPPLSIAGQLFIEYDPAQLDVRLNKNSFPEPQIFLPRENEESGQILLEFAELSGADISKLEFDKKTIGRRESNLSITYVFYDKEGVINSEGTKLMSVAPVPAEFALHPVYPNPFNPSTTIRFDIPDDLQEPTYLHIYDISGRLAETLISGKMDTGFHELVWSGSRQSTGIYFAVLSQGDKQIVQKMILLK